MQNIKIHECGAITGASEMIAIQRDLEAIWPWIRAEHPVDALESAIEQGNLVLRFARILASIDRIFEKRDIIVAGPELLLLEAIAFLELGAVVHVAVDPALSPAAITRVAGNVPNGVEARVTSGFPERPLGPTDSVLIAAGLQGGYRFALIPDWTAAVVRRYAAVFSGERILLDPVGQTVSWRQNARSSLEFETCWVTEFFDSLFTNVAT